MPAFEKLSTGGSIDLRIVQDGTEKVVVETDENLQEAIIIEVEDGSLKIRTKDRVRISATKLVVTVSCKTLSAIASGGSGNIVTENILKGDELSISHGGSGDFDLELDVKKLKISSAGSGDYKLRGHAGTLNLSLAGSGEVDAQLLDCDQAKIATAGSGDVHLKKGTTAKVSSTGSGDVTY